MTRLRAGAMLAVATAVVAVSCRQPAPVVDDLAVSWLLTPATPTVGQAASADVTLRQPDGRPVLGARLELEGHMTHPGMAPVVTPLADTGAGRYRASIVLPMSGDWVWFVRGQLSDGRAVRQRVAGVAANAAP